MDVSDVPILFDWSDSCEENGLILSPLNTQQKIESVYKYLDLHKDMEDSVNEWWQVGLKFIKGKCVWSNGEAYVPEKDDQLFHENYRPNCAFDNAVAYLSWSRKQLFSFTVDKHVNKLCSVAEPLSTESEPVLISAMVLLHFIVVGIIFFSVFVVVSYKFKRERVFSNAPAAVRVKVSRRKEDSNPLAINDGTVEETSVELHGK